MTQEFSPADFEPLASQTLVHTLTINETKSNTLSTLLPDLAQLYNHLSTLLTKAENPNSLLRKRCSDRHGDWLQIQFDLQDTFCQLQDIIDARISLDITPYTEVLLDAKITFANVTEDLSTHVFLIEEFIESLGLSKLARKDLALAEIERILLEAAREEREKNPDVVTGYAEMRLGGRYQIYRLLERNGVDRSEISRLDTNIKEICIWVFKNEPELTMVRDLEGFQEGNSADATFIHGVSSLEHIQMQGDPGSKEEDQGEREEDIAGIEVIFEEELRANAVGKASKHEQGTKETKAPEEDYQTVEMHHEIQHDSEEVDGFVLL